MNGGPLARPRPEADVIGSGFGGLAAAVRLGALGEELDGLYFVGAGTHPGAGLPGVLSSARVLDAVVPEPWGKS